MSADVILDLIRGPHLLGVILAMGAALYLDLRTLFRLSQPVTRADVEELHRIHKVVGVAFASLWITGMILIGYRTGFDLGAFSPKLWCKIFVVTLLTANSMVLSRYIIPMLDRAVGDRLIVLPARELLAISLVAGVSMSCWLLAFALGYSAYLKTSDWEVLLPILGGGITLALIGSTTVMFGMRAIQRQTVRG